MTVMCETDCGPCPWTLFQVNCWTGHYNRIHYAMGLRPYVLHWMHRVSGLVKSQKDKDNDVQNGISTCSAREPKQTREAQRKEDMGNMYRAHS